MFERALETRGVNGFSRFEKRKGIKNEKNMVNSSSKLFGYLNSRVCGQTKHRWDGGVGGG